MSTDPVNDGERMLGGLLAAAHLAAPEQLGALVAEYAAPAGLHDPVIYLVDLQQRQLVPLPGPGAAHTAPVRLEGTVPGRAYRGSELVEVTGAQGRPRLWLPLLDGTERLGVLGLTADGRAEATRARAADLASLVALLVASKRAYSDSLARLVRTRPMSLSAEVQWTLLPPLTCATDRVVISAALEPAYEVGGDAFDYGLSEPVVHLSIFDAMGHDLSAGVTATIAMGACRNTRRQGGDLNQLGEAIDTAVHDEFGGTRFATGVLADLDTSSGRLTWTTWGHPPPLIIRGGRWVATLDCPPAPPLGTGLGITPQICQRQLEPGDRLLMYTDGVTEARDAAGEPFGVQRLSDFVIRHEADGLSAPETLRRLIHTLLEQQHGELRDDATVLVVEWTDQAQPRLIP